MNDKESYLAAASSLVADVLSHSRYRFVLALVADDRVQVASNLPDADVPLALRAGADHYERASAQGDVRALGAERN